MSGQKLKFDTTGAIYIPHGLRHSPRLVTEYSHPHVVISIMAGAGTLKEVREDAVIYPAGTASEG